MKLFRSSLAAGLMMVVVCLALSGCKLLADLAPVHEDISHVHKWLAVPVFYVTSRKRTSGKVLDYDEQRAYGDPAYGVKSVVVPAPPLTEVTKETSDRLGWVPINIEGENAISEKPDLPEQSKLTIPDEEIGKKDVVSRFEKYRAGSLSKQVVIFAHGCCANFQGSLERAAKIAVTMQVPLVVFDWDSPRGFTKYLENETLAEQVYDDYSDFLNSMEKVVPAEDTILIGHSMGAHFLDDALVRRAERTRFNIPIAKYHEVILSQADIDARSYIRHNKAVAALADKVRIYFNRNDGRLDASATAHGGFERLGRPEDLLDTLSTLDNQDMIDITQCAMGHEIPFWVVADVSHGVDTKHAGFECAAVKQHYLVLQKLPRKLPSR